MRAVKDNLATPFWRDTSELGQTLIVTGGDESDPTLEEIAKSLEGKRGSLIGPLCPRKAHTGANHIFGMRAVLLPCAQWETNPGHPAGGGTSELEKDCYVVGRDT